MAPARGIQLVFICESAGLMRLVSKFLYHLSAVTKGSAFMLKTIRILNVAAFALLMPVFATAALAHAKLVKETPAHDATVPTPAEISLKFSVGVEAAFSSIEVKDAAGALVKVGTLAAAGDDKTTIAVPLPTPLAAGKYTVEWRALTAGDGHKIKGSYSFTAAP